jgi:RimJ/RimL family protein N-acetyltransferase
MAGAAVEILTPRLVLRTPRLSDAPAVQAAKEEVWHDLQLWMSWSFDSQLPQAALEDYIRFSLEQSPWYSLYGFRRDTGDYVVSTGLAPCDDPDSYVTGYWVAKPQLEQGFATEATNAAIRYAFGALKAKAMIIDHYEGNDRSANVIRKLGFTPEKVVSKGHKRCLDGTPLDIHKFRMDGPERLPPLDVSWT